MSAIFGMLGLWVIVKFLFLTSKDNQKASNSAAIFSLIAFTSPFILLFMPMARYYSLLMFLTAASIVLKSSKEFKPRTVTLTILVDTLLLYTNFIAGLILIGGDFSLFGAQRGKLSRTNRLLILLVPWVLFIPLMGYLLYTFSKIISQHLFIADFGSGIKGFIIRIIYTLHDFISGEFLYPWQPSAIIMLLLSLYLVYRFIRFGNLRSRQKIAWGILAPSIIVIIGSLTLFSLGMEFLPPRIAFAQPFLLCAIVTGLETISNRKAQLILLILILLGNLHADYKLITRQNFLHSTYIVPWEEIISDIQSETTSVKPFVLFDDESFLYYRQIKGLKIDSANMSSPGFYPTLIPRFPRESIWVIYSPKDITPGHHLKETFDALEKQGYVVTRQYEYLKESDRVRKIKERLLGREIPEFKKMTVLFELKNR